MKLKPSFPKPFVVISSKHTLMLLNGFKTGHFFTLSQWRIAKTDSSVSSSQPSKEILQNNPPRGIMIMLRTSSSLQAIV